MVLLRGFGATATAEEGDPTRVPMAWTAATPMPLSDAAIEYARAQCDDQPNSFYVIEGINQTMARTMKVWRYDADTDTWNSLAPIPNPPGAIRAAAVCHEGRIYVAGAWQLVGNHKFFIYDVANDTWSAGANMPRSVVGPAMGAFGGKVYVIGGDDDVIAGGGTSNEVDIYDIASDNWITTGAPMPMAVTSAGWSQIGPYVYVVGGFTDGFPVNSNVTQRYDMSADTWATGPAFTSQRASLALAATSQFLYAIGGDENGGGEFDPTALVERLDHTVFPAGAWTDIADPLPGPLFFVGAGSCTSAVSGGEIWTVDGFIGEGVQSINQYRPSEPCPPGGPPAPVVVKTGAALKVESCGPANGAIDPKEIVTVDFALRNVGSADAANVVATLQAAGGVTPITRSQTFGELIAGGPAVSRPFTFAAGGVCGGTLTASLAVRDGAENLGTKTFTFNLGTSRMTGGGTFWNPAPITINDAAPATPYPSDITVSGLTDTVAKVTVTLTGITHAFPGDVDILLVGPNGHGMVLLSEAGGSVPITDVAVTLDDDATQAVPQPIVDGTYWPFNLGAVLDTFPPPAPPPPWSYYGTELAFFKGIDPNGTWSLFVVDDALGDAGAISDGWSITITTAVPACCLKPSSSLRPTVLPPPSTTLWRPRGGR
jgi:subtilisin-like proprotein convertase family protein